MVYLWYISSNTEGNPNGGSCDMKFVRTEDLKAGMRLAKPIYNKKGVLLYERNSALTAPGIASAKNFGLIGVYILEPNRFLRFPVKIWSLSSYRRYTFSVSGKC